MNAKQVWQTVLGEQQVRLPRPEFDTWLKNTELLAIEDGTAIISVPTTFNQVTVEKKYARDIQQSLSNLLGKQMDLDITVNGARKLPERIIEPERPLLQSSLGADTQAQFGMSGGPINPRHTFSSFIVGSSNRMAHAACVAVAEHPAEAYNPLFLYGGVGLGKTHLIHAIGNHALSRGPHRVMYVSSEQFTNELINAIREHRTDEFRSRYRTIDILLIDDIQFIAGKESTQEEFFHTFNHLHSASKQIVMTSDRPPKAIPTLQDRLRSRFEGGLMTEVNLPDLETRMAILRVKAETKGVELPPDVLDFVSRKVQSNIRELEGALNSIVALSRLNGAPITLATAAEAMNEGALVQRKKQITPGRVVDVVASYYGLDLKQLAGKTRSREIVVPRQIAMYIMREDTDRSLAEIGGVLGGRDHTTVMHGCSKVERDLESDARLRQDVLTIREILYNGS